MKPNLVFLKQLMLLMNCCVPQVNVSAFQRPDKWGALVLLAALTLASGCETAGEGPGNVHLSPSVVTISVDRVETVLFTVKGGYEPYSWSVSDTNLGDIASSGDTAIYTPEPVTGENTVTATDTENTSVSAAVIQI